MSIRFVALLAVFLALNVNAHAGLINVSSPTFGLNSLTYDTNKNLYWLSPSETIGKSYNEVANLLSTDAGFLGFRFATIEELTGLFTSAGIPDINEYGVVGINGTTANAPGATVLQSLLGITYSYQSGASLLETSGFVGAPHGNLNNLVYIGEIIIRDYSSITNEPLPFAYVATTNSSTFLNSQHVGVGSWLVSSVPEPSSLSLMIAGLCVSLALFKSKLGLKGQGLHFYEPLY